MTMTEIPDDVVVTQEDWNAAEPFRRGFKGKYDREVGYLAEAFARHRLASMPYWREHFAKVADTYAQEYEAEAKKTDGPSPIMRMGVRMARYIAAAIRSTGEQHEHS